MNNGHYWLKNISIEGLHGELNIDIDLKTGINVIFGNNGIGKTTLLHIIANVANRDFERFAHIAFKTITLTMNNGFEVAVKKKPEDEKISVLLNGRAAKLNDQGQLSEKFESTLAMYFGKHAVYVPAFRNVLQKMEGASNLPWHNLSRFETVLGRRHPANADDENEEIIQKKTEQCRSWFGEFVPTIRYPSVDEARVSLEQYWGRADSAARRDESNTLSDATNSILADFLGRKPQELKELIGDILDDFPEEIAQEDVLAESLAASLGRNGKHGPRDKMDPTKYGAQYIGALMQTRSKRKDIFRKIDRFTESMNTFLEPEREFTISGQYSNRPSPRIFFKHSSKRDYHFDGLSSGERQLVTLLFSAWQEAGDSTLMLIDEPELSLHIDWQRRILKEMHKQSDQQIIACTHAPEVAADIDQGYQVFDRFSSVDDGGH